MVLAAGRGRRFGGLKQRVAVRDDGATITDLLIGRAADAGIERAVIVVRAEIEEQVRAHLELMRTPPIPVELAVQREPRGTADAVWAARDWLGRNPFLVVNGDNPYPVDALRALTELSGPGLAAFERAELIALGNIPAERVAAFAQLEVSASGDLVTIVEKAPALTEAGEQSALISMNAWRFDADVLDACRDAPQSTRGEYELTSAVQLAVSRGVRFRCLRAHGAVLDLSGRSDISEVSRRLAGVEPRP